jgi:hypothetical protein
MVVVSVVTVAACSGGLNAAASPKPRGTYHWRAAPGARVSLVPTLDAGQAGWCMQMVTRNVIGSLTRSSRTCSAPPTSTGPIFAEACEGGGREGAIVFVLTQNDVASVSIAGGRRIPTTTNSTLPEGLRAVSLQAPEYKPKPVFRQCPAVIPFDASGKVIAKRGKRGIPLAVRLPRETWEHPERPSRGVCEFTATQLRLGTVAWDGAVATRITTVPRLLGRALLSCAQTVYIHSGGHYVSSAVLLDASHPGMPPPPLPGMKTLAGHPGVFEAQSSEGRMVARRIPGAWLVVTEETPSGLAVPVELLEHLRATIHL